jgi:rhamnosyltransferase
MPGARGTVSITLLTRDSGSLLVRVLDAIQSQATEREVHLLAIDSGSRDGTLKLLREHGAEVESTDRDAFDFGSTRDRAFELARGELIVTLSQDAVPAHDRWLENLLAPFANPLTAVSCGASIPDRDRGFDQFPWERNGYFYFTREMAKFRAAHGRGISFSNAAVRRSVWERLRIAPQALGEDFQFQQRVHAAGLAVAFPGHAEVLHHHDYDLAGLWGRCRNEGLALRELGCGYTLGDLVHDLASPAKFVQWAREFRHGRLRSTAAVLFPVVRPIAVYAGARSTQGYRPYVHRVKEAA